MSEIDSIILNGEEYTLAGGVPAVMYSVTNRLTNVSNSNSATSIREGRAYNATLSVAESASLESVSVTMGGADITATAYNTSTKVISIASVTGNVVITARASIIITQAITWSGSGSDKTATPVIDATDNDGYMEIPFVSGDSRLSTSAAEDGNVIALVPYLYSDASASTFVGYYNIETGEIFTSSSWTWANAPKLKFGTNTLIIPHGYYAKIVGSNTANAFTSNGSCTGYLNEYGTEVTLTTPEEEEPAEEVSNAEATDNDLLQMYSLNAVSLNTSTVSDTTSYAGVIEEAKNAWMTEYGGSIDKIPLIIHTDQHDDMGDDASKTMWETIDNMVSWYDVSKVLNLGDTTNSYDNFDDPTLGDANLEAYLEATKAIPMSKRIEIFGNHDCMKIINASLTYIPTYPSYLNPYFKNVMARRTSNNGYHVTYDPYFNVKYIVISTYDYVDDTHYAITSPGQYDWVIEEMAKDDGYDIIVLSHVGLPWYNSPMNNLIKARYAKTSGSITDSMGNTHTYDFSGCSTNLLVCLNGHEHTDGYNYTNTVLAQSFKNYYDSTRPIFFVIVDRENNQLKVWKVMRTPAYEVYTRPFIEQTS